MRQDFIAVVVCFDATLANTVNGRLSVVNAACRRRFDSQLPDAACVHFISLNVVRDEDRNAYLVLEASVDGSADEALQRIAVTIGDQLRFVLRAAGVVLGAEALGTYLERHRLQLKQGWSASRTQAVGVAFSGVPGMSVPRIIAEQALAKFIAGLLEGHQRSHSALQIVESVRAAVFASPQHKWACNSERTPLLDPPRANGKRLLVLSAIRQFAWPLLIPPLFGALWAWVVLGALWGLAVLGLTLAGEALLLSAVGLIWYRSLRRSERCDVPHDCEPTAVAMARISERENRIAQNHLAGVSTLKPGRRLVLRLVLWLVGAISAYRAQPGFLSGIGSIHFARWMVLPGTDKLLFFSNYDGSWMSYLEDFILLAHGGLTAIWSNTRDFPVTDHLVRGGASDGARFKRWARRQQQPTLFWYSAYPRLTMQHIRRNARIRRELPAIATHAQAAQWLKLFGIQASSIEASEVPTLAFGGLRRLRYAHCLVIRFAADPCKAVCWLHAIRPHLTFGKHSLGPVTVLGLSASGLERIGLSKATMKTFPVPFQQGMAEPSRARALGDHGCSAPNSWSWGGPAASVDATLLLYDADPRSLAARIEECNALLGALGHGTVLDLCFDPLLEKQPSREPFGFIDGSSQPKMHGARGTDGDAIHTVEPGELILGYPSNLLHTAPTPNDGGVDLGRNGTYLVVRLLEQDPAAFESYLRSEAARLQDSPNCPPNTDLPEWIAAKMMGRWRQDGSSLVRHPQMPGAARPPLTTPDNDYLYGEDPEGLRCPFGAHIRRGFPRDSFAPSSPGTLRISNRHRMLRVGRGYSAGSASRYGKPGLLFMCVNADIENQFEFLQQSWLLGTNFHGLQDEADPVLGSGGMTIPTLQGPLHLEKSMSDFVRVRGGAYFFMPSKAAVEHLCSTYEVTPSRRDDDVVLCECRASEALLPLQDAVHQI